MGNRASRRCAPGRRNGFAARTRWGCFGGMCFLPQGSRRADRWSERSAEAGEPTGAREQVCGPDVILTTGVKGAREGARVKIMSVGCPQTAGRASRSGAGPAIGRRGDSRPKPKHAPPRPRHHYQSRCAAMPKPSRCYFTSSIAIFPPKRLRLTLSCLDFSFLVFSYALIMPKNSPSALTCRPQKRYNFIHFLEERHV